METEKNQVCTNEKQNKDEIKFSIAFKKDGESFQNVMEKILMNKMLKNI